MPDSEEEGDIGEVWTDQENVSPVPHHSDFNGSYSL